MACCPKGCFDSIDLLTPQRHGATLSISLSKRLAHFPKKPSTLAKERNAVQPSVSISRSPHTTRPGRRAAAAAATRAAKATTPRGITSSSASPSPHAFLRLRLCSLALGSLPPFDRLPTPASRPPGRPGPGPPPHRQGGERGQAACRSRCLLLPLLSPGQERAARRDVGRRQQGQGRGALEEVRKGGREGCD